MKHILSAAIFLSTAITGFGQIMQASIGPGSLPSRIIVYMKPTTAVTNGTISTLQFDVAINASITPAPTVAIIGATYLNITWNIDPSYIEDGYRHYQFTTGSSPGVTIGAGTEIAVFELGFTGGPSVPNNVALVTLGLFGGSTGNALFFCSGAANSVEGQLYYARAGTTVVNNSSYSGPLPSSSTLGGIILPVKWLSFDVVRQDKIGRAHV